MMQNIFGLVLTMGFIICGLAIHHIFMWYEAGHWDWWFKEPYWDKTALQQEKDHA